ncbi:DUF4260 domain-containing protein [Peribacillus sp. SI8-4]|uniref:DUF4260 domain-containing protein n=1 Tax=Peribacillus sp. SI8-4 TaxID=3048009 RepID=UPI002552D1B9|nr:DUF4260 domain-containing protein [Peribacillus sp. SI8-4]
MVKKWLHIEGLLVFFAMIYVYSLSDFSWWLFLLLLLSPDVSMAAYLLGERAGARVYNVFHTYALPILLLAAAVFFKLDSLLMIGLIWTAHIGMDRFFGYGLKYDTSFKATHMQKV